ncbi:16S rRNA (cytosine(1402)-N(4))-methyltransferase [candidate division WWE3 bacterium RIFCSPHIGHO2_01_FULL_40_23]|uniref:Ribosomal RNA small subunit methyltransferase H n=1 Tax=candidate division WWE3 bacterium RIFCSPLOWO2_01_FULL_41_18 TaxID=1802625 RepID=A0A1F4VCH8_UNCKA|nr:MAG: 16S rRNA (cytosine(1402)-N(4))-methyltransferase [candidate division WWE3 bacterium RIFCSPHIGHO2_01_FULL_40_23]OGC54952.1 MAG: 16S rRNA (cytosine(1402)-N(4))-methyltransferase [candidate division WWE3 bacterium RIFCSPLOWO2_01_FULL_41_18]
MKYHTVVMADLAIEHLKIKEKGKYIDATLGDGGHSIKILKRGGLVLGIDQDPNSLSRVTERLANETGSMSERLTLFLGNFKEVEKIAQETGFKPANGILYDLGTSYHQLEEQKRGFSYSSEEPLDMRMDLSLKASAKDLVNGLSEKELSKLIFNYGGEDSAKKIARAIVNARKEKPIERCSELTEIIIGVKKRGEAKIHPATKTFQALRIAVNDELNNLEISLSRAAALLIPGGRLVIITFHSLEDRIAKKVRPSLKALFKVPLVPNREEVLENPRSRSAKMRVFEKL